MKHQRTVVDDIERAALIRAWWQALATTGAVTTAIDRGQRLLADLIDDFSAALYAEPFDPAAGARIGAALAAAHLIDPSVPVVSAPMLLRLADHSDRTGTEQRLVALLAALGQGHQAWLHELRDRDRPPAGRMGEQTGRDGQDARFRIVFDNAAVAIAIADTDGTLLEANRGLADMIGVPAESLQGVTVYDFTHPDDRDEIRTLLYEKLVPAREGTVKLDRRLVRADRSVGWMSFAITYVRGADGQPDHLLAIGSDVTERHQLQQELHRQARHDLLTGLPNRRYLLERIEQLIATADHDDRAGLCFADLDHFKHVNDRYGHNTGDKALAAVAARLYDSVRGHDCLIARIGGDEFVALIPPPADPGRVTTIASRLLSAFSEPITIDGRCLTVSASIGAVVTPILGANAESLLDAADTTLYYAKTNGKGHWVLHTLQAPG
jgi:diguanylate cyclase (GGDEF)-like protein/PAS domain S-box-containing protein